MHCRDPRWGRFQESVSECPWLNGAYAANFVRGMQGQGDGVNYTKIGACCKHFYAYSLESSDGFTRHDFNAIVSKRDLAETYLVPFQACAAAGVEQIMCRYYASLSYTD
jgi:beta-glucosidase-like glycosyl hydrolase